MPNVWHEAKLFIFSGVEHHVKSVGHENMDPAAGISYFFRILAIAMAGSASVFAQDSPETPPGEVHKKGAGPGPKHPMAEAWKSADKDGDGMLSMIEFADLPRIRRIPEEKRAELFKRFDKNEDGVLVKDEFRRIGAPHEGQGPMQRLWQLDANKDGGVSLEEMKAGQMFAKLPSARCEKLFRKLDSDGDGSITSKDKPQPPMRRGEGKEKSRDSSGQSPKLGQMIQQLDRNGDGVLDFTEFRASPRLQQLTEDQQEDRFEALDKNGDLKLGPDDEVTEPQSPAPAPKAGDK